LVPGNSKTAEGLWGWLYSQGVSTVLLVLILIGCYRALPAAVDQIIASYERLDASHRSTITELTQTFQNERERERQQTKEAVTAIRELTAEIRDAKQSN